LMVRRRSTSFLLSSVGRRPARRSLSNPFSSIVQKMPRAGDCHQGRPQNQRRGFQYAAPDFVLDRVVSKECQVARTASHGDTRSLQAELIQGVDWAARASRFGVQAVSSSVFPPAPGQSTQAVEDEHGNFRLRRDRLVSEEVVYMANPGLLVI
jgi:hypothetical protein